MTRQERADLGHEQLKRVRGVCAGMPGCTEKLSHGEPTFSVNKRVFVMFANNHHGDGHVAIWIPAPPGLQATLIRNSPSTYFKPPYVGVRGWVGIELDKVDDEILTLHVLEAWKLIAPKNKGRLPRLT